MNLENPRHTAEMDANARLIAAAPETKAQRDRLLEELAVAHSQIDNNDATLEQVRLNERAKAKAQRDALLQACKALPLSAFGDEDNLDAAQFVDECASFLKAMRLARAAIANAEGKEQAQ